MSEVLQAIDVKSVTNAVDEIEVSMIFLVVTFFEGRKLIERKRTFS